MSEYKCPLCMGPEIVDFAADKNRKYLACSNCGLVFVPKPFQVSKERELERYKLHNNDFDDEGYRSFLERMVPIVAERVRTGGKGLDFGCGPSRVLADMLRTRGFQMSAYDPFFLNEPDVLDDRYEFVTATEVVEHLREPGVVFGTLFEIIREGGFLFLMTQLLSRDIRFEDWHYKNDVTHISFFSTQTLDWLSESSGNKHEWVGSDICVFQIS